MKKAWSLLEEGEGEGEEGAEAEEDELITVTDVMEALGSGEAPLCIPSGFRAVTMAPSDNALDRTKAESDTMLGKMIAVRCRGFGWCIGKIVKKVTRGLSNFVAKFDVDVDVALLSLESKDYDTAPDGAYEAWMILARADGRGRSRWGG